MGGLGSNFHKNSDIYGKKLSYFIQSFLDIPRDITNNVIYIQGYSGNSCSKIQFFLPISLLYGFYCLLCILLNMPYRTKFRGTKFSALIRNCGSFVQRFFFIGFLSVSIDSDISFFHFVLCFRWNSLGDIHHI